MRNFLKLIISFGFLAVSPALSLADEALSLKSQFKRPLEIKFPKSAPYSPQLVTLGKMLFFDPRLSGKNNLNCASCHNPSFGYEVPVKTPIGATLTPLKRQAPTLLNMAWVAPLFWDGRAETLEEQAAGPITHPDEMGGNFDTIIERLNKSSEYKKFFHYLFPQTGITRTNILKAIATYERTIIAGWAPFDKWVDGDETAISSAAKRGFIIFNGAGKCAACHSGWNFTDNKFHDIGLEIKEKDLGRAVQDPDDIFAKNAFKTPTLRNLSHRAPFMHNGCFETLEDVIDHYVDGIIKRPSTSPFIMNAPLSNGQKADLIAFLKSLSAEHQDVSMPILPN
ncbi:cytochrome c peroxidase [Hyphomicrobiales bacterium 4NK60-0047b]|jgi:cytochrome c peroxidase